MSTARPRLGPGGPIPPLLARPGGRFGKKAPKKTKKSLTTGGGADIISLAFKDSRRPLRAEVLPRVQ